MSAGDKNRRFVCVQSAIAWQSKNITEFLGNRTYMRIYYSTRSNRNKIIL